MRQYPYQHQFADDVDLDEIFIGREQQLDQFNAALHRWKPLATSSSLSLPSPLPPSPNNRIQGLVILLRGRGGFGKTTLLKQYHRLALEEASWLQSSAIVDWEFAIEGKRTLFNLAW